MRMSEKEFGQLLQRNPKLAACMDVTGRHLKKNAKYRNKKVYIYENGMVLYEEKLPPPLKPIEVYDSIKEYNRWVELQLLQRAGRVSGLARQVLLIIQDKFTDDTGKTIQQIAYRADFFYRDIETGVVIVEDVKAFDEKLKRYRTTKDFDIKWKLLKNKYPEYSFRIY